MDADNLKRILHKKLGLHPKGEPTEFLSDESLQRLQLLANQATGERVRYMTFHEELLPTVLGVEIVNQVLKEAKVDTFDDKCCNNVRKKLYEIANSMKAPESERKEKISDTQTLLSKIMSIAQNHRRLEVPRLRPSEYDNIVSEVSASLDDIEQRLKNVKKKWIDRKKSKRAGYEEYIGADNFKSLPTATKRALSWDVTPLSVLFFAVEEDLGKSRKELTPEKFRDHKDVYLGTLDRLIPRLLVMVVSNCLVSMDLKSTAMLKIAEERLNLKGDGDRKSLVILGECIRHSRNISAHELKVNEGEEDINEGKGDIKDFEENARCIGEILKPYFTVSSGQDGNPLKQTLADIFPGIEKFAVDVPEAILSGHTQLKKLMEVDEPLKEQKPGAADKSSALGHTETQVLSQPMGEDEGRDKDQQLGNTIPSLAKDHLLVSQTRRKDELGAMETKSLAPPVERGPPDTDKKNSQPFCLPSPSTLSQIPAEVEEILPDLKVTEADLEPDHDPCT